MSDSDLALVAALIFGWGVLSARLERFDVTAPIIFVIAGVALTHGPLAPLGYQPSNELIKSMAEITLVLVLFSDASRVGLHELRTDLGLYVRLLAVGLPLTIGLGTLLALRLPGIKDIWFALIVGAALAPTDAALGAGMIASPVVPARIRRLINVESGLNDGIATPFVSVALAGAATADHVSGATSVAVAVGELALGIVVGVAVGGAGGLLVNAARARGWAAEGFAGSAVLALAVCAYACALAVHGNGFITAFIGGLAFGSTAGRRGAPLVPFVEETGALVSLLVWLAFGAVAVVPAARSLDWQVIVYAVLSLTAVRMIPVAVCLAGTRLGWPTVAFVGWFGPRGLASVVFSLLALEDLGHSAAGPAVTAISITVLISVIVHGATAEPVAGRYAAAIRHSPGGPAHADRPELPARKLVRNASPGDSRSGV